MSDSFDSQNILWLILSGVLVFIPLAIITIFIDIRLFESFVSFYIFNIGAGAILLVICVTNIENKQLTKIFEVIVMNLSIYSFAINIYEFLFNKSFDKAIFVLSSAMFLTNILSLLFLHAFQYDNEFVRYVLSLCVLAANNFLWGKFVIAAATDYEES